MPAAPPATTYYESLICVLRPSQWSHPRVARTEQSSNMKAPPPPHPGQGWKVGTRASPASLPSPTDGEPLSAWRDVYTRARPDPPHMEHATMPSGPCAPEPSQVEQAHMRV